MNKSNSLHNDLLLLEAPLVNRVSLTMLKGNMEQCRQVIAKIRKENNLMFLRKCKYHLLQLAEEQTVATNRQLTQVKSNNVLSYEDYLSE